MSWLDWVTYGLCLGLMIVFGYAQARSDTAGRSRYLRLASGIAGFALVVFLGTTIEVGLPLRLAMLVLILLGVVAGYFIGRRRLTESDA